MAPSRTRFFFSSSWRCSTTSTPILTRARFAGPSASITITITWSWRCLLPTTAALRCTPTPQPRTKVTLRRAARVHARPAIPAPHPLTGLARSLSTAPRTSFPWPQPSAIPPRAYPQRLVPRAPRATALGRPARSPSAAPRASYPTSHSPRPSRQEPIHGASCLVSQTTCHQPPPQEPIHSASCLVHQATTLCPHTDATCLHPNPTMAAGLASRHPNRALLAQDATLLHPS